jgi:hypothetical protein
LAGVAEAVQPDRLTAGQVAFALERFERTDDGRLEIDGRWSGVRGRRFIRPSLTIGGHGSRRRLLAELEHKPWSAEDGEPWRAAFAASDVDVVDAELSVAPDISLQLPPPGPRRRRATRRPASAGQSRRPVAAGQSRRLDAVRAELDVARQELDTARSELDAARREVDAARREVDAARGEADATRRELADERAEAQDVRGQLESARAERDAALAARDTAEAERAGALAVRDSALAQRAEAMAEREAALAAVSKAHALRRQAIAERDAAVVQLHVTAAERDAAVAERDAAIRDRTAAQFELQDLREAHRHDAGTRDPTWLTAGPAPGMPPPVSPFLAAGKRNVGWRLRAVAVGVIIVIAIVIAVILGVF